MQAEARRVLGSTAARRLFLFFLKLIFFRFFFLSLEGEQKESCERTLSLLVSLSLPFALITHRITSFPSAEIDFVTSLGRSCLFCFVLFFS